jgi:hypothetical protein
MFEELKAALVAREVAFTVDDWAWCPTLRVERRSGGSSTVEVVDMGRGEEMSLSNDGGWPTTFRRVAIVAGTLAMIARC